MKSKTLALGLAAEALILITASASGAAADDPPPPNQGTPSSEGDGAPSGPGVTVVQVPSAGPGYPGYLPPAGWDPNGHLPSSSRGSTDISRSSDGFDLLPKSEGGGSFRGSSNGAYVSGGGGVSGGVMPEAHNVRRGDTLWDISNRYYQNPYEWPRVWSYNPQIQNPHWIYPGDRIHLRDPGDGSSSASSSASTRGSLGGVGPGGRRADTGTIFFGDVGWVDDKKDDTWGELVGSPSDRMMLGEGDDVYVQLDEGHEAQVGDKLTIFRPIRTVATKDAKGELVSIRGTARIDRYNPKTRMIRARVFTGVVAPCLHGRIVLPWVFGCLGLQLGSMRVDGANIPQPAGEVALWAAIDPRLGVEVPLSHVPWLAARLFGDLLVPVHRPRALVREGPSVITEVWRVPHVAGTVNLGLVLVFR
jgi:hypothetical protein